jgi:hypothetical protein
MPSQPPGSSMYGMQSERRCQKMTEFFPSEIMHRAITALSPSTCYEYQHLHRITLKQHTSGASVQALKLPKAVTVFRRNQELLNFR